MNIDLNGEYVTVAEAATFFRVSQSTIWRWINNQELPAYRFGGRRILLKRAELRRLLGPARAEQVMSHPVAKEDRRQLGPLSDQEKGRILGAIEAAKRTQQGFLERRHGVPLPSSHEILEELRDQRSRDLP